MIKAINEMYFIDECGVVTNKRGKVLSTWIGNVGYRKVKLRINKKPTDFYIHRLVATLFVDNPNNHPQVKHKDDNKLNVHFTNLEWGTNKENTQEGYDRGMYKFRQRCHKVKAVHKISGEESFHKSIRAAGEALGYNRKTITAILKNGKVNNYDHFIYYEMPND